jgi:Mrp family chromosome partitioning ATPase
MERLLKDLVERYEMVLLIVPPVLRIPDGLLLSRLVDGVVVVADERSMARTTLAEEVDAVDSAGGRVLGVVLTA